MKTWKTEVTKAERRAKWAACVFQTACGVIAAVGLAVWMLSMVR
jgi:nitrate reductase NapE component